MLQLHAKTVRTGLRRQRTVAPAQAVRHRSARSPCDRPIHETTACPRNIVRICKTLHSTTRLATLPRRAPGQSRSVGGTVPGQDSAGPVRMRLCRGGALTGIVAGFPSVIVRSGANPDPEVV